MDSSSDCELPAKRPRTDEDAPAPIRRSDLWFTDGNVVLQAESTQYKVHMSILSSHATVFCDMFAMGKAHDCEIVEDCPVVHVMDQEVQMTHFLKAIYDRKYFHPSQETRFPILSAMIILGQKYHAKLLYDDAISLLLADFPTDFDLEYNHPLTGKVMFTKGEYLDFVRLCHTADLPCFLPRAFPLCMSHAGIQGIIQGTGEGTCHRESLSSSQQRICIEGTLSFKRASLELRRNSLLDAVIKKHSCVSCVESAARLVRHQNVFIRSVGPKKWQDRWEKGLCDICARAARQNYEDGCRKLWNDFPSFYELPPWDELRAQSILSI